MRKITKLACISLFIITESAFCQPDIITIQGNIMHDSLIILSGNNFGENEVFKPLLWDNVQDNYATIEQDGIVPIDDVIFEGYPFRVNNDNSMKFSTQDTRSLRQNEVHYSGNSRYSYFRGYDYNPEGVNHGYPEMYLSWYIRTNRQSTSASTKLIRLWAGNHNGRTYRMSWTTSHLTYGYTNDVAVEGDEWAMENNDLLDGSKWNTWDGESELDEWHRVEVYFKSSSSPDINDGKILLKTDGRIEHDIDLSTWRSEEDPLPEYIRQYTRFGNDPLNNVWLIGFDPSVDIGDYTIELDDIYINNNLRRIELCSCDDINSSEKKHCEIQIPEHWSDDSISFQLNQGSFQPGDTAYLFVVDEEGKINSIGYKVIIGGNNHSTKARIISDNYKTQIISAFPNPASKQVIFQLNKENMQSATIRLYSLTGELLFHTRHQNPGKRIHWNCEQFDDGTYVFNAILTDEAGNVFNSKGKIIILNN